MRSATTFSQREGRHGKEKGKHARGVPSLKTRTAHSRSQETKAVRLFGPIECHARRDGLAVSIGYPTYFSVRSDPDCRRSTQMIERQRFARQWHGLECHGESIYKDFDGNWANARVIKGCMATTEESAEVLKSEQLSAHRNHTLLLWITKHLGRFASELLPRKTRR
jgi:hypothetical protein